MQFNHYYIFVYFLFFNCIFYPIQDVSLQFRPYLSWKESQIDNQPNLVKKIEDTEKRKKVVTYYYAEELIRKKVRWKGKESYLMILQGGATIIHEKTKIRAPRIQIDPDNNGLISGGVWISEEDQGINLYAKMGIYNRQKEYIKISGNPYMRIRSEKSLIYITTDEIIRDMAKKQIIFRNYVKMHSSNWSLFADESIYYDDKKEFILRNYPVLLGKNLYMTAKYFTYKYDKQKIIIDQNPVVITTISDVSEKETKKRKDQKNQKTTKSKKKEKKNTKKEIMVITADYVEYSFLKTKKTDSITGRIRGNVYMTSQTKTIRGEELILFGKEISRMESRKKVILEDKKEKFFLKANYMLYDFKKQYLILKKSPELIVYKKSKNKKGPKEIKQKLIAEVIERDFKNEYMIAKGNVYFKRGKEVALAELAKIYEKEEKMVLVGNPILKRGKSSIACKKIYITKDKIDFERELEASISD